MESIPGGCGTEVYPWWLSGGGERLTASRGGASVADPASSSEVRTPYFIVR